MPENLCVLCEGVGCLLRERCQRYVRSLSVLEDAEGLKCLSNCDEEERPYYVPVTN